jgi:transglutaminase-like putative cysteine protease
MNFERTFRFFLNGTALWAFAALVSTRQLHFAAVVVALPLMLLPMMGAARRVRISPAVWTFLTVLAFVTAGLNILVIGEIMYSIVYFFLFLEIAKLWTLERNRDVFQVLILSFFQVVAAAVMTASLAFAGVFVGYVFLVTVTWMLFSIRKEAEGTGRLSRRDQRRRGRRSPRPVRGMVGLGGVSAGVWGANRRTFLRGAAGTTGVLLLATCGIFVLIPRLSSQRFLAGLGMLRAQRVSGFAEEVDFEHFGSIQMDPTVIGRVQVRALSGENTDVTQHLRLRVTSLDTYTGLYWRKGRRALNEQTAMAEAQFETPETAPKGIRVRQDIILEPDGAGYFLGASMPSSYHFGQSIPVLFDRYNFSLRAVNGRDTSIRYIVDSNLQPPFRELVEKATGGELRLPDSVERQFLQMPDVEDMAVVGRLAREWTGTDPTPLAQARKIESRLQTRFGYTTEIRADDRERHLTEFLTERLEGHCEYFATAMTLMLRSLGTPARLVAGYYTDEYNPTGGYFLVRRQHAHSWVEAWIEPLGWVTFDPTPVSGVGAGRIEPGMFDGVRKYVDALRYFWYRHVIDFDLSDQFRMARRAERWKRGLDGRIGDFLGPLRGLAAGFSLRSRGISPSKVALLGLVSLVALGVGWLLIREVLGIRRKPRPGKAAREAVLSRQVAYYLELLRTLAARNHRKAAGQTPLEFARDVVRTRQDWEDFLPVTQAYYRARFYSGEVTQADVDRARTLIERIRNGQSTRVKA